MNETIQGIKEGTLAGFEKIATAFDIPAEYHEEAKEALSAELDGLDKEAGLLSDMAAGAVSKAGLMAGQGFAGGRGALLGAGAVAVGGALTSDAIRGLAAMAVRKIGGAFGASANRASYDKAFRLAMEGSEVLQNDPMKAKRMADTIFSFAPTVASDANVLTHILSNSIHGESMDLQTVKLVTELEEKILKMKNHP